MLEFSGKKQADFVVRSGILGNLEFQQIFRGQKMGFFLLGVALADPLQDVLGEAKEVKLTGDFLCSGSQETNKAAVVFQLAKGTLSLNRSVNSQQFPFFCGDPFK